MLPVGLSVCLSVSLLVGLQLVIEHVSTSRVLRCMLWYLACHSWKQAADYNLSTDNTLNFLVARQAPVA